MVLDLKQKADIYEHNDLSLFRREVVLYGVEPLVRLFITRSVSHML